MNRKADRWLAYWMILPVVAAVLAFVVGPTYDVGTLSFTRLLMGRAVSFGTFVNFKSLFADPLFPTILLNTGYGSWAGRSSASCSASPWVPISRSTPR